MATYTISEVEELTGVKQHVLRYWEETIPGFSPAKDIGGRRVYNQNDIDIILRLKNLIIEKRFTTEGAAKQLLEDAKTKSRHIDLIQEIHETRTELSELYLFTKKIFNH